MMTKYKNNTFQVIQKSISKILVLFNIYLYRFKTIGFFVTYLVCYNVLIMQSTEKVVHKKLDLIGYKKMNFFRNCDLEHFRFGSMIL